MKTDKLLEIARSLYNCPVGRQKHFSFIVRRNKILSVGWNNSRKTDPWAARLGHRFSAIHSEMAAIKNYGGDRKDFRFCELVNIRILNDEKRSLAIARPCFFCQKLLAKYNFATIFYSVPEGFLIYAD